MQISKSVKNVVGWILYLAFLAGLTYEIPRIMSYFLKTPYPMASITSGSMWPTLKRGDLVLIKGIHDKADVGVGDIIVYQNPEGFTIHRVIQINKDTVVTKGDANNVSDFPVKYEEIVGKTLNFKDKPFRVPILGNISIMLKIHNL